MRLISKGTIVINTESLFTLTSKWHHYPLALTCFLGFEANSSKMKGISLSLCLSFPPLGLILSSCRYDFPPAPLFRLTCMQLSHFHLAVIVRSRSQGTCVFCFNQTATRRQSHLTQRASVN